MIKLIAPSELGLGQDLDTFLASQINVRFRTFLFELSKELDVPFEQMISTSSRILTSAEIPQEDANRQALEAENTEYEYGHNISR